MPRSDGVRPFGDLLRHQRQLSRRRRDSAQPGMDWAGAAMMPDASPGLAFHFVEGTSGMLHIPRRHSHWLSFLALMVLGCGPQPMDKPVLTEQRFVASGNTLKQDVGGECAAGGTAACLSGICLHTLPGPHDGWVCSSRCSSSSECPLHWSCVAPHPDEPARVCVPLGDSGR